jgi:hypothetical protein
LRGIASQIDARPVYRCFLKKIMPTLKLLFTDYLMKSQENSLTVVREALKLCRTLLENKSQRLTLNMTAPLSYELVNILMPYWVQILHELNRQT